MRERPKTQGQVNTWLLTSKCSMSQLSQGVLVSPNSTNVLKITDFNPSLSQNYLGLFSVKVARVLTIMDP